MFRGCEGAPKLDGPWAALCVGHPQPGRRRGRRGGFILPAWLPCGCPFVPEQPMMKRSGYNRHPLGPVLALVLAVVSALWLLLFAVNAIAYAYRRIGIGERELFLLLWLSLLGGVINIPVARLRSPEVSAAREISVFGVRYRVPIAPRPRETVVAVNLGGALIPAGLSVYLMAADDIWWQAAVALALSSRDTAATAYVGGSIGTLLGADLLNLPRLRSLGVGVASIGGAGTFDGVFLSGIIAVILVGISWR